MIRVLFVYDHEMVRIGVSAYLSAQPDIDVVGEADNGKRGVELALSLRPDIILMDLVMKEMDGIEATRRIKMKSAQIPVIVLSMYSEYRAAALAAGANAFFIKGEPAERLLAVLLAICSTN